LFLYQDRSRDKKKPLFSKTSSDISLLKPAPPPPRRPKLDLLAEMKSGAAFLKFGMRGFPHFRHVQISSDHRKIQWFSKAKKLSDSEIYIEDIVSIRKGQTTAKFQRHPAPELEKSSFSVIYQKKSKEESLDLIAKEPRDFDIWFEGLQHLVDICHEHGPLFLAKTLNHLYSDRLQRPSVPAPPRPRTNSDSYVDDDDSTPNIAGKIESKEIKKKIGHTRAQLKTLQGKMHQNRSKMLNLDLRENAMGIAARATLALEAAEEYASKSQFESARKELWKADVEVLSLRHVL